MAVKFMLDTNIYDRIIKSPGMAEALNRLTHQGKVAVLTTFVQEGQIAAIKERAKRVKIGRIAKTKLPAAAGPWGLVPWGEFPWGSDGSEGGLSVHKVMRPSGKDWQDALIASTGSAEADVLVTEDLDLRKRLKNSGMKCDVWGFDRFRDYVAGVTKG